MVEVFKYTERVVSMIRPRKLLFMAIGELPMRLKFYRILTPFHRWCCPKSKDESATVSTIPLCPGST